MAMSQRRVLFAVGAAVVSLGAVLAPTARAGAVAQAFAPRMFGSNSWSALSLATQYSPDGTADLDGDQRPDLLQVRLANRTVTYGVRRGSTAAAVWLKQMPNARFGGVEAMRIGASARPGVVVASIGASPDALQLTAYDGRLGKRVWSWPKPTDVFLGTPSEPTVLGFVSGPAGKASNVLVEVNSTLVVVDGATGSGRSIGTIGRTKYVDTLDDVDGDGYGDILVLPHSGGVVARSSGTGHRLWSRPDVLAHSGTYLVAPDFTGDRMRDLLVIEPHQYTAIDSRTGRTVWRYALAASPYGIYPLGDANGDGRGDFMWFYNFCSAQSSGVTATALSGRDGSQLWRRTMSVAHSTCTDNPDPGGVSLAPPSGDVDNDGVLDAFAADWPSGFDLKGSVLNGRDGTLTARPSIGGNLAVQLLAGSLDGNGDDIVTWQWDGDLVSPLAAYDGASGQQLWSVLVKGDLGFAGATAVNVTGDSRDEVLAEFGGPNNYDTQMLLDGVTGRVIWRYGG